LSYLNRTDLHRDSPLLVGARTELADIANRDPSPNRGGAIQNNLTNRLYEAGQFDELLHHAVRWREANSSIENGVLLDALVIISQLHTGAIEDALAAIDALVSTTVHANYVLLSLHEALKKVGRELHRVIPSLPADRDRLQPALERVLERYNELGDLAGGAPSGQSGPSDCGEGERRSDSLVSVRMYELVHAPPQIRPNLVPPVATIH
jgi:hypothetical protein